MAQRELKALEEKGIQPGVYVTLPYRGGTRHGFVKKIALMEDETPHPPKVVQRACVIHEIHYSVAWSRLSYSDYTVVLQNY